MIMYKGGPIINPKTNRSENVNVRLSNSKNGLKDLLIGGGLVLAGMAYLTITTFRNGAQAFEDAEVNTLDNLDLLEK